MICERCHGTGMVREMTGELPNEVWVPCGDCDGCGCTACPSEARSVFGSHCCEGERGQPGGTCPVVADPL
jgi:hypothetical protein